MDLNCRLLPYAHAILSNPHLVKLILPWDENCLVLQRVECKESTVCFGGVNRHQESKIAATTVVKGLVPKLELDVWAETISI